MNQFKTFLDTKYNGHRSAYTQYMAVKRLLDIATDSDYKENDLSPLVTKFDKIATFIESKAFSTRNSYAIAACTALNFYVMKQHAHDEFVAKYRKIASVGKNKYNHLHGYTKPRKVQPSLPSQPEWYRTINPNLVKNGKDIAEAYNEGIAKLNKEMTNKYLQSKKRLEERLNIKRSKKSDVPQTKQVDMKERITTYINSRVKKDGLPTSNATKKNDQKIFQLMKIFNQTDLKFLVTKTDEVIDFLNKEGASKSKATSNAYYNVIVAFLPLSDTTQSQQDEAYKKYSAWQKGFGQNESSKVHTERFQTYDWPSLVNKVHEVIPYEKDPLNKLLMSLYIDMAPRRTKDFTFMVINKDDQNGKYNKLIFTKDKKQFIFNYFKTSDKVGSQEFDINKTVALSLVQYLKSNKDNEFLLMKNNKPLDENAVASRLRTLSKTYEIPLNIETLRKMYATYKHSENNPRQMAHVANMMGTSTAMLYKHYIQVPQRQKVDIPEIELPSGMFEATKQKKRKSKKNKK